LATRNVKKVSKGKMGKGLKSPFLQRKKKWPLKGRASFPFEVDVSREKKGKREISKRNGKKKGESKRVAFENFSTRVGGLALADKKKMGGGWNHQGEQGGLVVSLNRLRREGVERRMGTGNRS